MTHPLSSTCISIFSPKIRKFCYNKKYRYRLHFNAWFLNLLTFFVSLRIVLINMVTILMISAKMAALGLLKIKVSAIKFMNFVYDAINKIFSSDSILLQMWSCDQNLLTLAFLWEKLLQPQFCKDLTSKTNFFEGWSWFKFTNLGLAQGIALKLYRSVVKGLKVKVRKFWRLISTFVMLQGKNW